VESLPFELISFISSFRPLFRVEVFETFSYLMTGLLIGEAKHGAVRSSVFAPSNYCPQRISDLFTRYKLSHKDFIQVLVNLVLCEIYRFGLPGRLFWIIDTTYTEKPYSKKIQDVRLWRRTKQIAGRAKHLKGHCYLFASHLYSFGAESLWASLLVAALLIGKRKSLFGAVTEVIDSLNLPEEVLNVWIADRGLMSNKLIKLCLSKNQHVLGRIKRNRVLYFAPLRHRRGSGRKKEFGAKCRVDQLVRRYEKRLRLQKMKLKVSGKVRDCKVWDSVIFLRGIIKGKAFPARVIICEVIGSKIKPLYLLTTELEMEVEEAVRTYMGRSQIEVNFDEVKELGLSNYMGRSRQGINRWTLFQCLAQSCLKLISTGHLTVSLPLLNWSWYKQERTVGQIRRRLVEFCRPRISRTLQFDHKVQEMKKAA
jgi:hypothetical protein